MIKYQHFIFIIQVLLVTGGKQVEDLTWVYMDSTEILQSLGGSWRTLTARLPTPIADLQAGTANNIVYIFGKKCLTSFYILSHRFLSGGQSSSLMSSQLNTIYSFNKAEESWEQVGEMMEPRSNHAVELIENASQYCSQSPCPALFGKTF